MISSGAAKITAALSPIIPAGMIAGAPFSGPFSLESVMKRVKTSALRPTLRTRRLGCRQRNHQRSDRCRRSIGNRHRMSGSGTFGLATGPDDVRSARPLTVTFSQVPLHGPWARPYKFNAYAIERQYSCCFGLRELRHCGQPTQFVGLTSKEPCEILNSL